jgi:hypothetical protein
MATSCTAQTLTMIYDLVQSGSNRAEQGYGVPGFVVIHKLSRSLSTPIFKWPAHEERGTLIIVVKGSMQLGLQSPGSHGENPAWNVLVTQGELVTVLSHLEPDMTITMQLHSDTATFIVARFIDLSTTAAEVCESWGSHGHCESRPPCPFRHDQAPPYPYGRACKEEEHEPRLVSEHR